jgi:hypothetical protein
VDGETDHHGIDFRAVRQDDGYGRASLATATDVIGYRPHESLRLSRRKRGTDLAQEREPARTESVDVGGSEFRIGNKWRITEATQLLECP